MGGIVCLMRRSLLVLALIFPLPEIGHRVEAKTGRLLWKLPVGEPCTTPVVAGERSLLATHSGRLLTVDLS